MRVIWGGTFDPVHNGHITLAKQLADALTLECLYLMPCYRAVHKDNVAASPVQRLEMLNIATSKYTVLDVDSREIEKKCASYTYNSLYDIRQEIGNESLCFVMGSDSLATLPTWYRASDIHVLANIIVIRRPENARSFNADVNGTESKQMSALIELGFSSIDKPQNLSEFASGKFTQIKLAEMDISSTVVRDSVKKHENITHWVDSDVNRFIEMHNLYLK